MSQFSWVCSHFYMCSGSLGFTVGVSYTDDSMLAENVTCFGRARRLYCEDIDAQGNLGVDFLVNTLRWNIAKRRPYDPDYGCGGLYWTASRQTLS